MSLSGLAATAEEKGYAPRPFGFEEVEERARALAAAPFDARVPALPPAFAQLDYDAWRDIRFKPGKAFLGEEGSRFRLQLFHRGFLYERPVTVNLVRGGIATPIPYKADLFDFGRTKVSGPLPLDLGFAGIRIHTPLNKPDLLDELIVFVGASYFRFLGRDQVYGLSARGLAVNTEAKDGPEEFPFFREFWVEVPGKDAETVTLHALLDGPSQTGAYRFVVRPGEETIVSVQTTLFPRRALGLVGIAPLTSMYFIGETDRGHSDDYRPELHDSDGLQIAAGSGEWLWRPLDNPQARRISYFGDRDPKGFGLMQRDRDFSSYQDLEAAYQRRPSYFVEPEGAWGEGDVVLVELPTDNEAADNIVAFWRPRQPYPAGAPVRLNYRMRALAGVKLHPNGQVLNTFLAASAASGGARRPEDQDARRRRRFLIDFGGGDLPYFLPDPSALEVVASATAGRIAATSITPNPYVRGFRVAVDAVLDGPGTTELRAFLRSKDRTLTETWSFPWTVA
ncbi:Glucans biosynthesis protein G [Methylobacterium organophilum]|uniref:Glucans biosynthesis protein G n=1 Tax=Methylobacterium organophilum TaxID=410 RepID=A0ABQ4T452_METOR|nr:Glucans biosynthesis protein G [Methylobacterium organophilum]